MLKRLGTSLAFVRCVQVSAPSEAAAIPGTRAHSVSVLAVAESTSAWDSLRTMLCSERPDWTIQRVPKAGLTQRPEFLHDVLLVDVQTPADVAILMRGREYAPSALLAATCGRERAPERVKFARLGAVEVFVREWAHPADIVSRLETHLCLLQGRSRSRSEDQRVRVGKLEVDTKHRLVSVDRHPVRLTVQQLSLLLRLAVSPGETVTYEELAMTAGVQHHETHANLRNQLSRLRKRLGPAGSVLRSTPGLGMSLAAT